MRRWRLLSPVRAVLCAVVAVSTSSPVTAADDGPVLEVREANEAALRRAVEELSQRRSAGDQAPAIIRLAPGTYQMDGPLELSPDVVGRGMTLKAARPSSGEKPRQVILSGGKTLRATSSQPIDGQWRYPLPERSASSPAPRVILIEGELCTAARHPNQGYLRIEQAFEDRRSGFVARQGDLPSASRYRKQVLKT